MTNVLLLQLPIPKLNFGIKSGNIPLGAACIKQAADGINGAEINILPESVASYIGDSALIQLIIEKQPDILGFTIFSWNVERSLYIAEQINKITPIKIIFGGPEITPDNEIIKADFVDLYVYGEGEQAFIDLLLNEKIWEKKHISSGSEDIFCKARSPYIENLMEHGIQNLMLLETQRGCPYHCGFCFYNKSRKGLSFKDESHILDGVRWAVENNIDELYILDPSLNARPDLKKTLKQICRINANKTVSINSEIRAEYIDAELADLFAAAGFTGFEIGLQTTNKHALKIMRRPTDLNRFVTGATLLKEREILPRIDLISGLPGDDLDGFSRSIGFVAENNLQDDVQVFPLSVLPGTEFRKNSKTLGLVYETSPPYSILKTKTFSSEDLLLALDYAESLFDVALYPLPGLSVAWKKSQETIPGDIYVQIGGLKYITKIFIDSYRKLSEIESIASTTTFPYQVLVNSNVKDEEYLSNLLNILTINNPFSPIEIIFIEPEYQPDTKQFLSAIQLKRPHFLDNDLRYLYGQAGNRAVTFTLISKNEHIYFTGDMKRQLYHWTKSHLPGPHELDELSDFEGILIDNSCTAAETEEWQKHFARSVNYIPQISFSHLIKQKKWLMLSAEDEYYIDALTFES